MKSKKRKANEGIRNLKELDAAKATNRDDLQKAEGGSIITSRGIGPAKPQTPRSVAPF